MDPIVITGGAGFIGSLLCNKMLDLGYSVTCIDNMSFGHSDNIEPLLRNGRFRFVKMDVLDDKIGDFIEENAIVIHCAGIAPLPENQEHPRLSLSNNVAATANLLEACRIKGAKHFFMASTSAVYENNTEFPSKESDSVDPTILYSLGKKFCEDLCKSFYVNYGLPYTIFRFFNVYGPHHDCLRKNPPFIAYLVKSFLEGKQPLLHSNGKQRRDYIYVDDLLDLIVIIIGSLEKSAGKTYNICSGQTVSVEEIVAMTQEIMNVQISPVYREPHLLWEKNTGLWCGKRPIFTEVVRKEVVKYSEGSYAQAADDYGWKPKVDFRDGLRNTIEYSIQALRQNT